MRNNIICCISLLFVSCTTTPEAQNQLQKDILIFCNSLMDKKVFIVGDSTILSIDENHILIAKKRPFLNNSKVLIHEITSDGSFINKDFNAISKHIVIKTDNQEQDYYFIQKDLTINTCKRIKVGEYYIDEKLEHINLWGKEIDYSSLIKSNKFETGTTFLGINPQSLYMGLIKEHGVFFKTSGEFYIWIFDNSIFFIKSKEHDIDTKVMFHILEDKSFINKDFVFSQKLSNKLLLDIKYEIAELSFSEDIFNKKIRIGEYIKINGQNKNLWSQEIDMKDVYTNELLRFQNELQEVSSK